MMNREIKFKAYERGTDNILYWCSDDGDNGFWEQVGIFYQRYDVVQHTGLKDKNGKEIYEGDIVKWGHIEKYEECWHRVAFVKLFPSLHFKILHYIDGKTLEKKKGDSYCFHYGNFIYKNTHQALEVIGNIYENEDLLNEK